MPKKSITAKADRTIALCYIRKSWTREKKDEVSPKRQRDHIQAICNANGWTPEWYEDIVGHRSGMYEKNRPGWLALKARLNDRDVVALVANDLARLHRKGWRIGDLLDFVDQHGIHLVLADPRRQIDFSTPYGRMFAQLSAIFDEWYATDVSERWKADIAHRKAKGVTVGLPPFGTRRSKNTGFLVPSQEGAWLLPDGTWQAGRVGEASPIDGALWRGYFECAERILTMYADEQARESICRRLQSEGWAFRDRQGQPAPLEIDDVRRVVSNWAEYGGHVSKHRARERHPVEYPPDEVIANLNPKRAVFDVDLLARVARTRRNRALRKHPTDSINKKARAYPLSGLTYCAHCERMAQNRNKPQWRSLLSGRLGIYYRHKPGGTCGCEHQSVRREVYEADFFRLIKLLEVKPEAIEKMLSLASQFDPTPQEEKDLETQKTEAIAICNRRIQAAIDLYSEGRIDRKEYRRRIDQNEREIASWQARTNEHEQLGVELAMCLHAIETITRLWEVSSDEDKQGMARHLFDSIVYDLDTQQIVDFKLKPWADQFLMLRAALYAEELHNEEDYNDNRVTPTGLGTRVFTLKPSIHVVTVE
jgi:DNA invertase Pin-like site-specific DNA recombinase